MSKQTEIETLQYNLREEKNSNESKLMLIFLLIGFCIYLFVIGIDNPDIDKVGKYMCEQHNLTLHKTQYIQTPDFGIESMKITCKNLTQEKQIADSYLVEVAP